MGYSTWGRKGLDMTESHFHLFSFSLSFPASKLSPNSAFFPLLPILSLESFHLWVKTSTSSYLFIFIDFLFYRLSLETKSTWTYLLS